MIIGNIISEVSPIEDYVQISFIDGGILNLYNDVTFSHQYQQYSNEMVKDLIITENLMCIKIIDKEIAMGMKEEEHYTAEAFAFCSKNEEWIVG